MNLIGAKGRNSVVITQDVNQATENFDDPY